MFRVRISDERRKFNESYSCQILGKEVREKMDISGWSDKVFGEPIKKVLINAVNEEGKQWRWRYYAKQ